ncbi:PRC-barrel domain containing protein [Sphingomonas solaris]|uniref:PRC-barrel domain containing protein n=2 Tax=Alterirhizorhabdus solaris TaxID=2529389 RepID=A0A558RAR2_9SPHN|nr:PRC-barrel domain containing protein [Sphingomonas solaris]
MIAAMMTAANLGTRVTGWGFIVFTVGSIGWSIVAISTGQHNLLLTNGFLTLVNVVGIWRWLGRQARYEDGSRAATIESAAARVPTLFSAGALVGHKIIARDGTPLGTVVDGMLRCGDKALAYVVVGVGGLAGIGEELRAVDPARLVFQEDGISTDMTLDDMQHLPVLPIDNWPAEFP